MEDVDQVFIINLENRKDRKEQMIKEMEKIGITNYTFFKAIKPSESEIPKDFYANHSFSISWKIGSYGCMLSHYNIIKISKEKNYKKILVLEDDCIFTDNDFINISNNLLENIQYDAVWFGGTHKRKGVKINNNLYKIYKTKTTHSMLFTSTVFDFILKNMKEYNICVDAFYASFLQKKFNCLVTIPHLCIQREDYSNIINKNTFYNINSTIKTLIGE